MNTESTKKNTALVCWSIGILGTIFVAAIFVAGYVISLHKDVTRLGTHVDRLEKEQIINSHLFEKISPDIYEKSRGFIDKVSNMQSTPSGNLYDVRTGLKQNPEIFNSSSHPSSSTPMNYQNNKQ